MLSGARRTRPPHRAQRSSATHLSRPRGCRFVRREETVEGCPADSQNFRCCCFIAAELFDDAPGMPPLRFLERNENILSISPRKRLGLPNLVGKVSSVDQRPLGRHSPRADASSDGDRNAGKQT